MTQARFPIGFLIFSYPWFSHTYPDSNLICPSTRIRHISGLFLLRRTPLAILNTILTVQLTLAYSNLASTRFPVHSVFKNFHYGERIRVDESQIRKYVWTKVQYSIFIKSPLRGSSDLIYKIELRKKNEKKT